MAAPAPTTYRFASACTLPTASGVFEMRVYTNRAGVDAVALVARLRHGGAAGGAAPPDAPPSPLPVLLRIQDQCMTSEIFGSVKCDCRQQLDHSMAALQAAARAAWAAAAVAQQPHADPAPAAACPRAPAPEHAAAHDVRSAGGAHPRGASDAGSSSSAASSVGEGAEAAAPSAAVAAASRLDDDAVVGAVIYLLQEGRGIGLAAKVAAYSLQEPLSSDAAALGSGSRDGDGAPGLPRPHQSAAAAAGLGLDTVDANRHLGLPDDTREYSAVVDILCELGLLRQPAQDAASPAEAACGAAAIAAGATLPAAALIAARPLHVWTNNPRKLAHLRTLGVPVAARLPCCVPPASPLAAQYLRAKAERMGHAIPAELYSSLAPG